jgi:hypothetical protein
MDQGHIEPRSNPAARGDRIRSVAWPALPLMAWEGTRATLHHWLQIAGKVRLVQTPWQNHSWHAALYVTARGLTSSPIPCGARTIEIDFDFIDHHVSLRTSDGAARMLPLRPLPVADFYRAFFAALSELGLHVRINAVPNEMQDAIPFEQNHAHASYDAEYANRFWRVLAQADRVLKEFRSGFIGKCSPVQFFWGSLDLAATRFSGRRAPEHPGGVPHLPDWVVREAYSHEVSSCGFWPGGGAVPFPAFYSYAYPEPEGYASATVRPAQAYYDAALREFILPYDAVREAGSPDAVLLDFLQTTYEAAADLGGWRRNELEASFSPPGFPVYRRGYRIAYSESLLG